MIGWMVSSSVLLAVLLLLRRALRGKISPRLGYALWGLALARLLIPFSLGSSPVSVSTLLQTSAPDEALSSAVVGYVGADLPDLAPPVPDPDLPAAEQEAQYEENLAQYQAELDAARAETGTPVTAADILLAVWVVGAVAMALVFLGSNLRLARRLRRSRTPLDVAGVPLPVYRTGAVDTPCLFGLVRPAIYLTPAAADDPVAARHAVEHERTHFSHGDHIWAILRCVCLALHWYNPLVWWAALASRNDGELACDEATIRRLGEGERAAYGRTLIALTCVKRPALTTTATTMTGSRGMLRARIAAIARRPKTAALTLVCVVLIAVVAAGCTFTGSRTRTAGPGEDPTADPTAAVTPTPEPEGDGPTVTALGEEEPDRYRTFLLTYGGQSREFNGSHAGPLASYPPRCGLVDLDGDGQDEIAVVLTIDHGSAFLMEELYVFRSDTLEEVDGSELVDDFLSSLTLMGDEENYYLSAPGPLEAALSKAALREWAGYTQEDQLLDVLRAADLVSFYREGGNLYIQADCKADLLLAEVCSVAARVTLDGDRLELMDYAFTSFVPGAETDYPTQAPEAPVPSDPADPAQITLPAGLDAQGAAEQFVQTAYPELFLNLPASDPRAFLRYELMDWSVREVSEDGSAVAGTFQYAFEPPDWNAVEVWSGNTGMGTGEFEGLATETREFLLERRADGTWACTSVATGGVRLP